MLSPPSSSHKGPSPAVLDHDGPALTQAKTSQGGRKTHLASDPRRHVSEDPVHFCRLKPNHGPESLGGALEMEVVKL